MLTAILERILDWLVARVYGHYAHPYTIYFTLPSTQFRRVYELRLVCTHAKAVEIAKRKLREGKAISYRIVTRAGYKTAEGTV